MRMLAARLISVLVLSMLAAVCVGQLTSSSTATFTSQSGTQFSGRNYPLCAATPSNNSPGTLWVIGGYTVGTSNTYRNDVWSSSDNGNSWTQRTANGAFPATGWTGAAYLNNGSLVILGTGGSAVTTQSNELWQSADNGATWTSLGLAPFEPRENFGYTTFPGTNTIVVALGGTNDQGVDDIWYNTNGGASGSWQVGCNNVTNAPCPLVSVSGSGQLAGQVHGPALVGFYDQQTLVLIGGYDTGLTNTSTYSVLNYVAYSTNYFQTYTTYQAPFSPRGQPRATVDTDNWVYVYGGVIDLGSQSAWTYNNELWYSSNAASTSASWNQLATTGLASVTYGTFASTSLFNGCFFARTINNQKALVYYGGVYAYYLQYGTSTNPTYLTNAQVITFNGASAGRSLSALALLATVMISALSLVL